jgi:hypothetical protein
MYTYKKSIIKILSRAAMAEQKAERRASEECESVYETKKIKSHHEKKTKKCEQYNSSVGNS